MPVAVKQDTFLEDSQYLSSEHQLPKLPQIDVSLLHDIRDLIDKRETYQNEIASDKRVTDKLDRDVKIIEETIGKAEKKLELLSTQNVMVKNTLDELHARIMKSTEYWESYGLDARQITTENEIDHYEFIFTKLHKNRKSKNQQTPDISGDDDTKYIIGIKFHDNKLEIVSQDPEVLSPDRLTDLQDRISSNCISNTGIVDYRSAMVFIRKDLIKGLYP